MSRDEATHYTISLSPANRCIFEVPSSAKSEMENTTKVVF